MATQTITDANIEGFYTYKYRLRGLNGRGVPLTGSAWVPIYIMQLNVAFDLSASDISTDFGDISISNFPMPTQDLFWQTMTNSRTWTTESVYTDNTEIHNFSGAYSDGFLTVTSEGACMSYDGTISSSKGWYLSTGLATSYSVQGVQRPRTLYVVLARDTQGYLIPGGPGGYSIQWHRPTRDTTSEPSSPASYIYQAIGCGNPIEGASKGSGPISTDGYNIGGSWSFSPAYITQHLQTIEVLSDVTIKDDNLLVPSNPYDGGDNATDDPGDGEFDYGGDTIDIPDIPSVSVTDSGFVRLFAPSSSQLEALGDYLWSDAFSVDSFKKIFNNPMDCILGLSIVPVNPIVGSAQEITVGNILTTVSANVVTSQYVSLDCGTLTISPTKFTGGYLDYAPYTKAYIYLPFIGIQQLNIDDIMHSTLHVVYHVDLLTGACIAYISATNRTTGGVSQGDAVLYTFAGQCAEPVPLSSSDYSSLYSGILQTAGAAAGLVATVATGGAAAPVAAGLTGLAGSAASTMAGSKPNITRSGSIGGGAGMMCIKYPFMIFDAPHTAIPTQQYAYTGFPSNKITKFSNLSGFAVVQATNLGIQGATDAEVNMIKSTLQEGVIF